MDSIDILRELKQTDVLMLMSTEPQLTRFGWGAIDSLEKILYPVVNPAYEGQVDSQ